MNLRLSYNTDRREGTFSWEGAGPWVELRSILLAASQNVVTSDTSIRVPWHAILVSWDSLADFFYLHPSVEFALDDGAKFQVSRAASARQDALKALNQVGQKVALSTDELQQRLTSLKFGRELKPFQLRNVAKIAPLLSAASFSVPGAGKTTEALAYFAMNFAETKRLLVIAPKNAFAAWDEGLQACLKSIVSEDKFVRLVGGESQIRKALLGGPNLSIIAYSQLSREPIPELVSEFVASDDFLVILDESHRIKHGASGKTGAAVLQLSPFAKRKLILSGTPMPQSRDDLVPQLRFLFPEVSLPKDDRLSDFARPIFVRTIKSELGLPSAAPPRLVAVEMTPAQSTLNRLLQNDLSKVGVPLSRFQKQGIRQLRRKVLRLIQLNANPNIVVSWEDEKIASELIRGLAEEPCAKIDWVCDRVRELAGAKKKTLVWSNFSASLRKVVARLADLSPEYIDGSVDAGSVEDPETREARILRFSTDPKCFVLIANPMAAAEGMSLHMVCHHAIYLDRTFNAAQYLQSLDRIHRIGMPSGTSPQWEIVYHPGTIDEVVDVRLRAKIDRMSTFLDDPDLRQLVDQWVEPEDDEPVNEEYVLGADIEDIEAAIRHQ